MSLLPDAVAESVRGRRIDVEHGRGHGAAAAAGRHVVKKSMWSMDEDMVLREQVRLHGAQDWDKVCLALPGRTAKSCRLRWHQHLDPAMETVKPFTGAEDMLIIRYQAIHGNRWSTIASYLPGRSDNAVKNRWNSVLRKTCLPYKKQPSHGPYAAGQAAVLSPGCLPLLPLASGDARGLWQGFRPVAPVTPGEDVSEMEIESERESDAAFKCLELFPVTPGDIRGNATAAASKDMSCGAGDPLTELRLAPAAMVVFDVVPLQARRI